MLHEGYVAPLHASILELSSYPASGSGEAANLMFAVTYMGGWEEDAAASWRPDGQHPPVRLDVTGSDYPDLYRVTNITSNIGTAGPGVFEPYDHETEQTAAEPGRTYTVRAQVEFIAEAFVPVYARGLDGDVVTINVAASEGRSMPYLEYLAEEEDYLDYTLAESGPVEARELPPGAVSVADLEARHGVSLKGMLSSAAPRGLSAPLSESSMPATFDAVGNVTTAGFAPGAVMHVHGIQVCAYDLTYIGSGENVYTRLNTTAGEPACAYTDDGGRYHISRIVGADPHDATGADVFFVVYSRGYGGAVELATYKYEYGAYYLYYDNSDILNTASDYGGGMLVRDLDVTDGINGMDGAARIISTLSDGMAFFERHGQAPAGLAVSWQYDASARFFPDKATPGAAYLPGEAIMWLDGSSNPRFDDSFDRHTILHELGHHVHAVHDPGLEFDCSPHWYRYKHDERCAWGEGWAQLVPHLVYDNAVIPFGGLNPLRFYDLENGGYVLELPSLPVSMYYSHTFEASGRPIGDKVEGSVAAAMWDMIDGANDTLSDRWMVPGGFDGRDDAAAGADALVGLFFSGTYYTFAEFYDRWEIDMRRHSAERVAILHGMSFAIPNTVPYYGFAGELDGVFDSGLAGWRIRPNYVDVSADGSTAAVTSDRGRGLQVINVTAGGEHMGLYAGRGYDYRCTLEYSPVACSVNYIGRRADDLGPGQFSRMDGVTFDPEGRLVLVTDGPANRVHILHADGRHAGQFGGEGDGEGLFRVPDGVAFLPNGTAAVADYGNRRVQVFDIADDGSGADYAGQFTSYAPAGLVAYTTQQLAAGHGGSLYAADYGRSYIWVHPLGADGGNIILIDDNYTLTPGGHGGFGGIAVGHDGLVYASNHLHGRVLVYNVSALNGTTPDASLQLGGRPVDVYGVRNHPRMVVDEFGSKGAYPWQFGLPHGVAVGPPDETGDVSVYVADHNGVKMYEKDRRQPTVEAVWAHTPDGNVTAGRTVEIAVNFSERVTVAGIPALILDTGAPGSNATYASGSGSRTLTFNYTVLTASADSISAYLDYSGTDSLVLPGGPNASGPKPAIMDGSGNAANLTLPARGTAGSLAANSALWIDLSGATAPPLAIGRPPSAVAAVEGREVRFGINVTGAAATPAGTVHYSLAGGPDGATIHQNGTFTWTPSEAQDGLHAFAVNATVQGNSTARAFRVSVAEDNEPPSIDAIPDMNATELSEIRFDVRASDGDLPAQQLKYRLEGNFPWGSTVLPNGTFSWTPSIYDGGRTHPFNVSVSDGFGGGQAGTAFAAFNVTVEDVPQDVEPITAVRAYSLFDGPYSEGETVPLRVEFSAPIRVDGSPELRLDMGGGCTAAAAYNGSVGSTVFFSYAVGAGHISPDLEYAGTGALVANGAEIRAASGEDVVNLALPNPGGDGSLSRTSDVVVNAMQPALRIGVIGDESLGGAAVAAARLAASDFNEGSPSIRIGVTECGGMINASTAEDALRAAHDGGAGPRIYIGPIDDEALHAAMPYADAHGIVLVSTDSTAPSLAVRGDRAFRLAPGDAMQEVALSEIVRGSEPSSVGVVLDEDYYGPAGRAVEVPPAPGSFLRGLAGTFAGTVYPAPQSTTGLSGPGEGWADEAAALADAVGSRGGAYPAIVFFGTGARLGEFAAHADNHDELRSARWFAAGPSHLPPPFGEGPAATPFAAGTNLTTVTWAVPENNATGRIDAHLSPSGAVARQGAYAAYDAVALLGRAAAAAGSAEPAAVAAALPAQLSGYDGALGGIALDGAGDLIMPNEYRVWTVRDLGTGPAWVAQQGLVRGASTCEARLGSPSLDFNVIPGRNSAPSMQTVINSGSLPLARIDVSASPWAVDPSQGAPGETLPASLAELGLGGPSGAYEPLGGSVALAEDVAVGANASAWLRINLTGHAGLQGGTIAQNVTYTVSCGDGSP